MRGLKQRLNHLLDHLIRSHPIRVRGLKHDEQARKLVEGTVAPYTGAWIETNMYCHLIESCFDEVAPYTGAWIETCATTRQT